MAKFKTNRIAYFGDETKPTKVIIEINKSVPIMNLSNTGGLDSAMTYNQSVKSVDVTSSITVHETELYDMDENGVKVDDRYNFICIIPSIISNSRGMLYHDTLNKDLFIIPDTELLHGDVDSNSYLENNSIKLYATLLGKYGRVNDCTDQLSGNTPLNENDMTNFSVVNAIDTVTVHLLALPGLDHNGQFNNHGYTASPDHYYESKKNTIVQFISLGSTTDVFNVDTKVPLHKIISQDFANYNLLFIGNKKTSDMLIPVNF